jgi:hypothetical protein
MLAWQLALQCDLVDIRGVDAVRLDADLPQEIEAPCRGRREDEGRPDGARDGHLGHALGITL